jgi:methionyl-tRNA synthetase
MNALRENCGRHMARLEFAKALEVIFLLVDSVNKYINDQKPWNLFKEGKQSEAEAVVYVALEALRSVTVLLYSFIPNTAEEIWSQLGFQKTMAETIKSEDYTRHDNLFDTIGKGKEQSIKPGELTILKGPVFKRIEEPILSS